MPGPAHQATRPTRIRGDGDALRCWIREGGKDGLTAVNESDAGMAVRKR